jgi:phosphoribosylaminoimidazole-succinocarboxamide synthase
MKVGMIICIYRFKRATGTMVENLEFDERKPVKIRLYESLQLDTCDAWIP